MDPVLHRCCHSVNGYVPGIGCLARHWDSRIRSCFKKWANSLKRNCRKPNNEFLSYVLGEGESISQISDQVSRALQDYNHNFQELAAHSNKVDYNLNSLSQMTANISAYERHLYKSNVISSLLAAQNSERLYGNLQISNDLMTLTTILNTAGVDKLLQKLSDGLLKHTPRCRIIKGKCVVHSYLTQSTSNDSVNLHEISKGLVRSKSASITCIPQLGKSRWLIPSLNRRKILGLRNFSCFA